MKKAIINGGIGSKVICAVTDDVTLEAAPIKGTDNGDGTASLLVTSSMAVLPDTTSGDLAAQTATLEDILAKIIIAPSTEAKQDDIITALGLIASEATTGDIKTAVEALAALISAGTLSVSLGELPDTVSGDLADINAASASINDKLPALVGGKIPVDASVSIDPAGLATEATAGDIKTAVEALAGATPDTAAGDLADINAAAASIDGKLPALVDGKIPVDASVSIDPAGLATQATLADILAKIIAAPSTEAKQDLILTALGLIATEATTGDIKTATEALAALISAGALAVSLGELPDTAAGDLADINAASASINDKLPALVGGKIPVDASVSVDSIDIGDVDIKEFPAGNLGQQLKAASLSVAPATDIVDATYIGDIKFGEELPAGTQLVGKVGIDQTTPGTTNLVNVNGGTSQTTDIKVTLDSESVAVTGPLTNAELTAQALATEATLGTMQADIALMRADLAAILAILES